MALLDVVFRVLNKAATAFIEPRIEDGHGSAVASPSYGEIVTGGAVVGAANPLAVNVSNPVFVQTNDYVSTANSTTTPLSGGATFTGAWENILNYADISITVNSDSIATSAGLRIDFSTDGVNIDRSIQIDIQTGGDFTSVAAQSKFFRIRITAGVAAQTYLRAQSVINGVATGIKAVPLNDVLTSYSTAIVTKSSLIGRSSSGGGTFVDVKANPSGALTVDASGSSVSISGQTGTWGYVAGVSGTPTLPANSKVLKISCTASSSTAGSLTINGGSSIPVPVSKQQIFEPKGNLVSPTVVFTTTDSYFIEYVV